MADLAQLESALVKADAAGDVEGARILAAEVRKMRGETPASNATLGNPTLGNMADQVPGIAPKPLRPITPDNPNIIDKFLLDKFGGQLAKAPDIQGSIPARVIQGAADLPVGAMQLGMNAVGLGDVANPEIKAINDRTQALRGPNAGFDWARLGGNVATGLVMGAPASAPTILGRMGQGAMMGGAYGAATPVTNEVNSPEDFWLQKLKQTGTGTITGGIIPAITGGLSAAGKLARNVVDPWLPGGTERAAVRTAEEAAGPRLKEVAAALKSYKPSVAGEAVGAGEASAPAGSAEFAALQDIAKSRLPSKFTEMERATNQARVAALRGFGKDKTALDAAIAERSAAAGPLYEAARTSTAPINMREVVGKIDDILQQNPGNRELVSELNNIKSGITASSGNVGFGPSVGQANAQKLSSVLDGLKAAIANKDNAFIKGNLNEIKSSIADAIPGYQTAQSVFAEKSVPINQMQIGQYLENKLAPALADQGANSGNRASMYAQALRDVPGTIKRSTGAPRYDELSQILAPEQIQATQNVGQSLARRADFEQLAKAGMPRAREMVGQITPEVPSAGMFNPKYSVIRAVANRFAGKAEGKSLERLAELMADPAKMSEKLNNMSVQERGAIVKALRDYGGPAMTSGAAMSSARQ